MSSVNKAIIVGNLGADPEVRYTQSNTAVATLSVATSERYKDNTGEWKENTEWHRIVAWGRTAEIAQEYLRKGSKIYVEGPIQTRQWQDSEGQTRYTTEIKALTMRMLDSRGDNSGGGAPRQNRQQPQQQQQQPAQVNDSGKSMSSNTDLNKNFDDIDDDLPF